MKRLQLAGIKLKIDKCKIAVPKVKYSGYIITQYGIKMDPGKIKAIINIERPKDENRSGSS